MSVAIFALPPSFHHLVLPDGTTVDDALRYVLITRKRNDNPAIATKLSTTLTALGATCLGDLRRLSDHEWRTLDMPAMARIYLKYLTRQSSRGPNAANNTVGTVAAAAAIMAKPSTPIINESVISGFSLEFNRGIPIDVTQYSTAITALSSMGFAPADSLEALLVTNNGSVQVAAEYLLSDPKIRSRRRIEAVERLNKSAAATSVVASGALTTATARALYREYLRGVIVYDTITIHSFESLKSYRERARLTDSDHALALRELGMTEDKFESIKAFGTNKSGARNAAAGEQNNECVVCLDGLKTHIIIPCMHLCLCEDCVESVQSGKNPKCPLCDTKITQIAKIFT